jgi:hypothetical protein
MIEAFVAMVLTFVIFLVSINIGDLTKNSNLDGPIDFGKSFFTILEYNLLLHKYHV